MPGRRDLERDKPRHDEVELGPVVAVAEYDLIPLESRLGRERRELFDVTGLEPRRERVLAEHLQNGFLHRLHLSLTCVTYRGSYICDFMKATRSSGLGVRAN